MANAAGFIQESIWRDTHWRQLSRSAQATYLQLLSQKELDCAGVQPLQVYKWAKGCNVIRESDVWADLEELQQERFVFFDTESDELFVRTYIRNSNVIKVPNMMKSALRSALLVASETIRVELAAELRATGRADALETAEKINPSGTPPEPFGNPSELNGSETLPEPTGVGVGVGVPHLGKSSSGEAPSEFCSKHPEGTEDACFACGQARRAYPDRMSAWLTERREAEAAARQAAIDACPLCDEFGDITFDDSVRKCPHQELAHA